MSTEIVMPQLGESVVEGTLVEWYKQVGEQVEAFEPIIRVSTDKVDTEIPAPASGVLRAIHIAPGETVDAGVVLGVIGTADEIIAEPASAGPAREAQAQPAPASPASNGQHPAKLADPTNRMTPVVARMVATHNIDLARIQGTGRDGRITKKDVEAYLAQGAASPATVVEEDPAPWEQPGSGDLFKPTVEYELDTPPTSEHSAAASGAVPASPPVARPAPASASPADLPGETLPISPMRRAIAEHMVHSKLQTAPHVTTVFEADLSRIVAHREAHKDDFARRGVRLTFTPYFVAACVSALRQYPVLHARWTEAGIFMPGVMHIGIATALEDGLIVPVLKNAQDYNLMGLARQVNDLAERARRRQLKPDEVRDGTFTITNHGISGSLFATPIINQPQSAILGVGAIEKRVKVIDDAIAIRPCAYLSLTFDHRLIDGAEADAFMSAVKQTLEAWDDKSSLR